MGLCAGFVSTQHLTSIWCPKPAADDSEREFSAMDRRLVRFAYESIPNGATAQEIHDIVAKNWKQ
jgi:hypothetical protein